MSANPMENLAERLVGPHRLTFDQERHLYCLDGMHVPSVTQALGILDDKKPFYTERSRQRGNAVHKCIELINEGSLDESSVDPAIAPFIDAYMAFAANGGARVLSTEQMVFSPMFRYAGTADLVLEMDEVGVWDTKTGDAGAHAHPQTSAYFSAYNELTPWTGQPKARERGILRLRKDGKYRLERHTDHDYDWMTFAACLHITHYKQRRK